MRLDDATDVFCRSFAFTRSLTHPFEFVGIGDLRVMRDAIPKRDPRTQEIVVCGIDPEEALRQVKTYDPPRHFLCVMCCLEDLAGHALPVLKAAYKAGGYRMLGTEEFFVRDLSTPIEGQRNMVNRVTTRDEADRIAKAARSKQIPADQLGGRQIRLYAAWSGGEPVGWVRSIHLQPEAAWASNLYVEPSFRRKGIGRALMAKMLQEDALAGVKHSVLLASRAGSLLYPLIGYEKIGVLLMFSMKR